MLPIGALIVAVIAINFTALAAVAVIGWLNRTKPGGQYFTIHVGVASFTALLTLTEMVATRAWFAEVLRRLHVAVAPVIIISWFLFVHDYLGYETPLERLRSAVVVPVALLVPVGLTFGTSLFVESVTTQSGWGYSFASATLGPLGLLVLIACLGLFPLGGLLLARTALFGDELYRTQATLFLLAIVIPWAGSMFHIFGIIPETLPATMLLIPVPIACYSLAFWYDQGFTLSPATGRIGIRKAFDELDAGVVVVNDGRIVLANETACALLDRSRAAVNGEPIEVAFEPFDEGVPETFPAEIEHAGQFYEVLRSEVETEGYVLLVQDVTRRQTREQRLDVLNRVLRHNLRNNACNIIGRAELIADGGDPKLSAAKIIDTTRDLVGTADRARQIEHMMTARGREGETALRPTVDHVVERIERRYPNVEVTTALPTDAVAAVNRVVFEIVLNNVVENAAEHNDADEPLVVIRGGHTDDGSLAIAVADNGPGIPEHERNVIEAGEEDSLEHGSGLGLWAVYWGTTQMGGRLSIADNEPRGAVVTITVPAAEASDLTAGKLPDEADRDLAIHTAATDEISSSSIDAVDPSSGPAG